MAENKEKILIQIEQSNYDGVFGFGAGAKVWQCTKAEAIETMASALVEYERTDNPNACEWNDLKERAKDIYRGRVEYVLNVLLEGK